MASFFYEHDICSGVTVLIQVKKAAQMRYVSRSVTIAIRAQNGVHFLTVSQLVILLWETKDILCYKKQTQDFFKSVVLLENFYNFFELEKKVK